MIKNILYTAFLLLSLLVVRAQDKTFSEEALVDTFMDLEGKEISFKEILKQQEGKPILLDIWASWCKDCIVGMPVLEQIKNEYPEAAYIYISLDKTKESWEQGIDRFQLKKGFHYWAQKGVESELFSAIELDWIPRYMVLNKTGEITLYKAINANNKKIIKQLRKLTDEK